jgi:hypothetical protein
LSHSSSLLTCILICYYGFIYLHISPLKSVGCKVVNKITPFFMVK